MKLLMVTPYFYPKIGGLENYAFNMAKGLKKYKWEVVIVTSNHKNKKNVKEKIDGLTIYRLGPWFKLSNTPINPMWYFKMKEIIKHENPDVINAHTPVPFIAEISALASGNKPFILTYHALSLYKQGFTLFNVIVFVYKQAENYLFHKAKNIIVVSEYIKNKFSLSFRKKVVVINNSIKESEIFYSKSGAKKENIVLFAGNLDKSHNWKGLDSLLEAVKVFIEKYGKEIKLIVMGDGNWRNRYENSVRKLQIEDNVSFVGIKTGNEKSSYFKKAKLAIIYPTTSNDALPTFLLESWAGSIAIVGSFILPLSKIVVNNLNGLLIKPSEPKELAFSINKLLTNNKLRIKLSRNGLNTVKKSYLFENELKKFNLLLNNIL